MKNELKPIKSESGNLVAAGYDAQTQELFVEFKDGKTAKYPNFPADKYLEFEKRFDGNYAESAGKFFFREIRSLPFEYIKDAK